MSPLSSTMFSEASPSSSFLRFTRSIVLPAAPGATGAAAPRTADDNHLASGRLRRPAGLREDVEQGRAPVSA